MDFYIIVCHSKNRVIGKNGDMPWHISQDLKRFKQITLHHPVVMGRKTYESLQVQPLPDRQNIVLSRHTDSLPGCDVIQSPDEVENVAQQNTCFVIGGAQIYSLFLPRTTRIYRTLLDTEIEGDAFFPKIDSEQWELVESEPFEDDGVGEEFAMRFEVLDKKPA